LQGKLKKLYTVFIFMSKKCRKILRLQLVEEYKTYDHSLICPFYNIFIGEQLDGDHDFDTETYL